MIDGVHWRDFEPELPVAAGMAQVVKNEVHGDSKVCLPVLTAENVTAGLFSVFLKMRLFAFSVGLDEFTSVQIAALS